MTGHLYLLHYERPLQAGAPRQENRHYFGYAARDVWTRIGYHATGTAGATFTRVAHERGIPFTVAGVWSGARWLDERIVKRRKNLSRICRLCIGRDASIRVQGRTLKPQRGVVQRWLALQSSLAVEAPRIDAQSVSVPILRLDDYRDDSVPTIEERQSFEAIAADLARQMGYESVEMDDEASYSATWGHPEEALSAIHGGDYESDNEPRYRRPVVRPSRPVPVTGDDLEDLPF
jgi:hypothetical protein